MIFFTDPLLPWHFLSCMNAFGPPSRLVVLSVFGGGRRRRSPSKCLVPPLVSCRDLVSWVRCRLVALCFGRRRPELATSRHTARERTRTAATGMCCMQVSDSCWLLAVVVTFTRWTASCLPQPPCWFHLERCCGLACARLLLLLCHRRACLSLLSMWPAFNLVLFRMAARIVSCGQLSCSAARHASMTATTSWSSCTEGIGFLSHLFCGNLCDRCFHLSR